FAVIGSAGVRLFRRAAARRFEEATEHAGLTGITAGGGCWVDFEHDGDLDLALVGADGLRLWQNNGNGTFREVTEDVGLTGTGPAADVAAADVDGNTAVDLVVARGGRPTVVWLNLRAGTFARMAEPPGPWPAAERVLLNDLNNDGRTDAVLLRADGADIRFSGSANRLTLSCEGAALRDAVLLDYDNDGRLDVLVAVRSKTAAETDGLRLFRNEGGAFPEVSTDVGLAEISVAGVHRLIPLDADADGDSDLLVLTETGLRVFRNEGGNRRRQLKVRLATIKTNPSGYGTHLEVRAGSFWLTRTVSDRAVEIGVGEREQLDALQVVWTNGVVDNLVKPRVTSEPITFVEKNVAAGSCPFLYAWDGARFRFVTDILGNAPIGLPLRRGVMLPADADEIVTIGPAEVFPPKDGAYTVVVTDEFREVLYLDQAKLIAVDHPPDVEVHPTDKLMPAPFPPSEVVALRNPRLLQRCTSSDGMERTQRLRYLDGRFADAGDPLPPPYRGMCRPLTLTLDFGPLDPNAPLMLAMTGWLQYGDG
ncbi:MAG: VCBS repeat-containing protein, partial [Planctomycetota bacterium]